MNENCKLLLNNREPILQSKRQNSNSTANYKTKCRSTNALNFKQKTVRISNLSIYSLKAKILTTIAASHPVPEGKSIIRINAKFFYELH